MIAWRYQCACGAGAAGIGDERPPETDVCPLCGAEVCVKSEVKPEPPVRHWMGFR